MNKIKLQRNRPGSVLTMTCEQDMRIFFLLLSFSLFPLPFLSIFLLIFVGFFLNLKLFFFDFQVQRICQLVAKKKEKVRNKKRKKNKNENEHEMVAIL